MNFQVVWLSVFYFLDDAYVDFRSSPFCGGSLISDKHVLTSAYCASLYSAIYVHLGDTILGNDKDVDYNKTIEVASKYLHPDYVSESPYNVNNILEMAEPVPLDQYPNIKPVYLPERGADFTGTTATVSGWGKISSRYETSWLSELQVTVFADDQCAEVTPSELCAGVLQGNEAPCEKYDGGPLVVSDPNANNNATTCPPPPVSRGGHSAIDN